MKYNKKQIRESIIRNGDRELRRYNELLKLGPLELTKRNIEAIRKEKAKRTL